MKILITGGAGFIGSNLAQAMFRKGHSVTILDNLSRKGVEQNLNWLLESISERLEFIKGDIRDPELLNQIVKDHSRIFHLAGQVAVTQSVLDPRTDFEVNAVGTINLLEAARHSSTKPTIVLASTNKVYGNLENVKVVEKATRYEASDYPMGVDEHQGLDFHSPYGCSKGASDQYVRDYARIYGLPTVVCRMSCIYGMRQFGNEDQGWVAHFIISWLLRKPITIYGDGKQVRDILFVSDLVRAFELAAENIDKNRGQVFNIGGGPSNGISLLELIEFLKEYFGYEVPIHFNDWRSGDQKFYVSDIRKAEATFGWKPLNTKEEGLKKLIDWAQQNISLFQK
ncbi:MAG: SDR family NAD(P)-dependent oxidoreductase [Xenococcaceae cyanobacterium]